ncbi:TIGR04282 family arsenosugar biosynthesis glycosyltransferase [Hymenobacter algoricola]|uniref:TIGR04282 family arsenosugar biosynthesis glycosyltransferase n=1 Tax=Hymenobacter algoricola TaxID=486267 RepID=A0ABP7MNS6_9BACT
MQHLLIFARHPELGRVKTRLARTLGDAAALAVYGELLALTRAAAGGLAQTHKTVWFADHAPAEPDAQWAGYETRLQPAGELGHRMSAGFAQAFAAGATAAVIIGTDCPALTTEHLQAAFAHLETHDVVLGPAEDGGYYLLGLKKVYSALFAGKVWSTDSVLSATLADAQHLGLRVALLPRLQDVDTEADLMTWRAKTGR